MTVLAIALAIRTLLLFQIESGISLGFDRPGWGTSLLLLALTGPLGILIHEAGHFAAGLATGQYCRKVVLGPLEFARYRGVWCFRWVPLRQVGLVDLVPSTFSQFRLRRALCVAAGPLASLLSGFLFVALSTRAGTAWQFWIWSSCAQWALVGLMGLLPMRRGEARSDGALLWELARGGAATDELQRDLLVAASDATPLALRDWPDDVIRRLPPGRYSFYLAYVHLLDRGAVAEAGEYLDRVMAEPQPDDPPEYALEAAYFFAFHRGDGAAGDRWLALETRDAEPWVRLRARAAIERANGNPEVAAMLVEQALAGLRAASESGAHQYEIDRLNELR